MWIRGDGVDRVDHVGGDAGGRRQIAGVEQHTLIDGRVDPSSMFLPTSRSHVLCSGKASG